MNHWKKYDANIIFFGNCKHFLKIFSNINFVWSCVNVRIFQIICLSRCQHSYYEILWIMIVRIDSNIVFFLRCASSALLLVLLLWKADRTKQSFCYDFFGLLLGYCAFVNVCWKMCGWMLECYTAWCVHVHCEKGAEYIASKCHFVLVCCFYFTSCPFFVLFLTLSARCPVVLYHQSDPLIFYLSTRVRVVVFYSLISFCLSFPLPILFVVAFFDTSMLCLIRFSKCIRFWFELMHFTTDKRLH